MKRHSIKMKVTLWYTGIVAIVLGTVFAAVLIFVNKIGLSATEEEVQGAVTGFASQITFKDNTYYMDGDIEFYDDGVMFCVYDEKGQLLYGSMPIEFPKQTKLQSHKPRVVKKEQKQWMIYDSVYSYGEGKALWIRGITSIHSMEAYMNLARRAVIIIFPGLILLIGWIGYIMIQRALKPVDDICHRADEISSGDDLSKRLPMPKVKDEIYDLTERFNEMFERLQQSFETEKQFTADASHELRTPVAVLISQCEYLLEHGSLTEQQKEEVEILLKQSQRISQLVSQLLMIAREEKMVDIEKFEDIDLGMLTEIIVEELEIEARKKSISIYTEMDDDLMIRGDQTLLMRMMMNLISNAIFYGKKGGYVKIRIFQTEDHIKGQVKDNGIGIGPEHIDKIWNRFYRVDKSRTSKSNGTGLGLAIVKWIVKVHKGEISVESTEGIGTTFSFCFPKE